MPFFIEIEPASHTGYSWRASLLEEIARNLTRMASLLMGQQGRERERSFAGFRDREGGGGRFHWL